MAQVPRLLHLPQADAIQRLRDAGFKVQVLSYRRSLPSSLYHRVLGVSSLPATHLARGSIVTLYTAVPRSTHS
jgi:beta-lactam-binding protein with PASTA domain